MGLFDNFAQKVGSARTGQPRQPVPGATPMPSTPRTAVPPPSPASGPVGRPPSPSPTFPGGVGAPLPLTGSPGALPVAPTTPRPSPTPTPAPETAQPVKTAPENPVTVTAPTPTPAPAGGAPASGVVPGNMSVAFDHVPTSAELASTPAGVAVQTPFGTVDRATGALVLSPEGKQAYQEAVMRKRNDFGPHPWANDATAPPIPITLGKPMFNPWTARWMDRPAGWGVKR